MLIIQTVNPVMCATWPHACSSSISCCDISAFDALVPSGKVVHFIPDNLIFTFALSLNATRYKSFPILLFSFKYINNWVTVRGNVNKFLVMIS